MTDQPTPQPDNPAPGWHASQVITPGLRRGIPAGKHFAPTIKIACHSAEESHSLDDFLFTVTGVQCWSDGPILCMTNLEFDPSSWDQFCALILDVAALNGPVSYTPSLVPDGPTPPK